MKKPTAERLLACEGLMSWLKWAKLATDQNGKNTEFGFVTAEAYQPATLFLLLIFSVFLLC